MLLIRCPWCGERAQTEFTHGGDASVHRPDDPAAVSLEAWAEYLFLRENPRGPHRELWHHAAGCRRWIEVTRDTRTHEIVATAPPSAGGEDR